MLCPDCVECCQQLKNAGIEYEFCDFADSLIHLKGFLAIRDQSELFCEVRKEGRIGIPCIVDENGTVCLSWECYVSQDKA